MKKKSRAAKGRVGERFRKKDIRAMDLLCIMTALLLDSLCFLFLTGILQNQWVLDIVLLLGILLNLTMAVTCLLRKKAVIWTFSMLMVVLLAGSLLYFAL